MTRQEILLADRCANCRRKLNINNQSGYCGKYVCRKARLKADDAYRAMIRAKNNRWHARKYSTDEEWASRRRENEKVRMSKKRATKEPVNA